MEQAAKRSTIRTTQFCLENTVAYTASTGTSSTCRETHVSLALVAMVQMQILNLWFTSVLSESGCP